MKILVNCPSKTNQKSASEQPLNEVLTDTLLNHGMDKKSTPIWEDDKTLVADNLPQSALHTFLLKAEELGMSYSMEKKLTITFMDN